MDGASGIGPRWGQPADGRLALKLGQAAVQVVGPRRDQFREGGAGSEDRERVAVLPPSLDDVCRLGRRPFLRRFSESRQKTFLGFDLALGRGTNLERLVAHGGSVLAQLGGAGRRALRGPVEILVNRIEGPLPARQRHRKGFRDRHGAILALNLGQRRSRPAPGRGEAENECREGQQRDPKERRERAQHRIHPGDFSRSTTPTGSVSAAQRGENEAGVSERVAFPYPRIERIVSGLRQPPQIAVRQPPAQQGGSRLARHLPPA